MKTVFRLDATAAIGGGHAMRCLTLAYELARGGAECLFLVNETAVDWAPALARSPFARQLAGPDGAADADIILGWANGPSDIAIVDSYSLDARYERELRRAARKIMVIDDLADRPHDCDVLLDSMLGREPADYAGLVSNETQMLLGPAYAMLRPEFAALRGASLSRRHASTGIKRILVSLGLTDVGGITARVVEALRDLKLAADVDVVIGAMAQSRVQLVAMGADWPKLHLHIDPPDMAKLMVDADLAIGAGGTTTWERCCLGLPTIMLVLADNQRLVAERLAAAGAVLGFAAIAEIGAAVGELAKDANFLRTLSLRSSEVCDGAGTARVLAALTVASAPLYVVESSS
jgi:UDP-2,4-diacetamido-2,4,6-trideoxy-beta-L-altropyranose hydrolase